VSAPAGSRRLRVDPVACDGRGLCAELLHELIELDEWGFPIISDQPVPLHLELLAERAVSACPVLALSLVSVPVDTRPSPARAGGGVPGAAPDPRLPRPAVRLRP